MHRFIESIRVEDGKAANLVLHNERLNRTRRICLNRKDSINLAQLPALQTFDQKGIYKCRILYAETIEKVEFQAYQIRPIQSLKLVAHSDIDYTFKYEDRTLLHQLFLKRGDHDDVIIVKNGLIRDAYYANLVFDDGNALYTPSIPLLKGVKREQLLIEKRIEAREIRKRDLKFFKRLHLVNAMMNLGECVVDSSEIYGD